MKKSVKSRVSAAIEKLHDTFVHDDEEQVHEVEPAEAEPQVECTHTHTDKMNGLCKH